MKKYGLLGKSLGHSFSKAYFTEKFQTLDIEASYENYELNNLESFKALISNNPGLKGLNVTIPYKTEIIPFLDYLSPVADTIQAVNTIQFVKENGQTKLVGHNTDVIGFQESLRPLLRSHHHKALILGKGGAAKAVEYVLKGLGLEILYVSRSKQENAATYDELNENAMKAFKAIINCTPLGTHPNIDSCPNLPYDFLTPEHLLYDLVYNPSKTKFLSLGEEKGALIQNGRAMLEIQAEAAWEIWKK